MSRSGSLSSLTPWVRCYLLKRGGPARLASAGSPASLRHFFFFGTSSSACDGCRVKGTLLTSHLVEACAMLVRRPLVAGSAEAGAARVERVLSRSGGVGHGVERQVAVPPGGRPPAARAPLRAEEPGLAVVGVAPAEVPQLPRRRPAPQGAPDHVRRRVRRRQEAHGGVRPLPGRTVLETIVVRAPTRRSYLRRLAKLARRCGMAIALDVTGEELDRTQDRIILFLGQMCSANLDAAVADHLNEEFFEGTTGSEGSRLLAALAWAFASVGKQVCNLPRSRTCSIALRRLAPGESRLPVPESLLFVVANELIARGRLQQGVAVLVAHHCYLRPGELSRTTWQMVHPPVSASGPGATVTIVLHPFELGVSSKVGEFDETIKVDWPPLAAALLRLRRIRPPDECLAGVSSVALGESVTEVVRYFGLEDAIGEFMMYRLRHSGPSADFLSGRRTIPEIKHRGRWSSDSSVRRYQKGGRINELLSRCSAQMKEFAARCLEVVPRILQSAAAPLQAPAGLRVR